MCICVLHICLLSLLIDALSRESLYSLVKQISSVLCWIKACEENQFSYAVMNWLSVRGRDLNQTMTYIRLNCL